MVILVCRLWGLPFYTGPHPQSGLLCKSFPKSEYLTSSIFPVYISNDCVLLLVVTDKRGRI